MNYRISITMVAAVLVGVTPLHQPRRCPPVDQCGGRLMSAREPCRPACRVQHPLWSARCLAHRFGHSKVGDQSMTTTEQNVLRLDVTMNDAVRVSFC